MSNVSNSMNELSIALINFKEDEYLLANPDVSKAVQEGREPSGLSHYIRHGFKEGRSLRNRKSIILRDVNKEMNGIEIGPYFNPLAPKKEGFNCLAFDVFSTDELRQIALNDKHISNDKLNEIEDVDILGTASEFGEIVIQKYGKNSFDYIISSHNLEHIPNPVKFLQGCSDVLKPNGFVSMAIPDLRCCFDFFRWPTPLSHWLEAYFESRKRPTIAQIFEQNSTHCRSYQNSSELVSFNLSTIKDTIKPLRTLREAYDSARNMFLSNNQQYIDCHCWTFTPSSFEQLIMELQYLDILDLECTSVIGPNGNEFYVYLRKMDPSSKIDENSFYIKRESLMRNVIQEMALKV